MTSKSPQNSKLIINRQAKFHYNIIDSFQAGIVLQGAEVKSIRAGNANLKGAYASIQNGQIWLKQMHVSPYQQASNAQKKDYQPEKDRLLLLHKKDIHLLEKKLQTHNYTLVPLNLHLSKGKIKAEIALAEGKKLHDKRSTLKRKDQDLDVQRALKNY